MVITYYGLSCFKIQSAKWGYCFGDGIVDILDLGDKIILWKIYQTMIS